MTLKEYKAKRDFRRTSEPSESRDKSGGRPLIYAIQKHHASRLHYDLRLESEGVLLSWAVPKEPVNRTGVKRLAVQTEDHPLGYEEFEGRIPEGEYGAGSVAVWDMGSYRPVETSDGKLVVDISGRRLAGRFALIKIKDRKGGQRTWLLFKVGDGPESRGRKRAAAAEKEL